MSSVAHTLSIHIELSFPNVASHMPITRTSPLSVTEKGAVCLCETADPTDCQSLRYYSV